MHPELHRYLDGEIPREALPPELRAEAEEWERLAGAATALGGERAPAWLETRVMASLPDAPRAAAWRRAWDWLVRPQTIRLRPGAVALAGVAALELALAVGPEGGPAPAISPEAAGDATSPLVATAPPGAGDAAGAVVYVQFVLADADARSVAVAGDFNDWDSSRNALRDPDGDGVWTGLVALRPGIHKYMFVVDGERWVTDPRAERYVDDGFGMRNALIAVTPPARRES